MNGDGHAVNVMNVNDIPLFSHDTVITLLLGLSSSRIIRLIVQLMRRISTPVFISQDCSMVYHRLSYQNMIFSGVPRR